MIAKIMNIIDALLRVIGLIRKVKLVNPTEIEKAGLQPKVTFSSLKGKKLTTQEIDEGILWGVNVLTAILRRQERLADQLDRIADELGVVDEPKESKGNTSEIAKK